MKHRISGRTYSVAGLERIAALLSTYRDAYYRNHERGLSQRMYDWIDYYNDARDEARDVWEAYCTKHDLALSGTAFDIFA